MTDPDDIINRYVELLRQDPGVVDLVDADPGRIYAEGLVNQNQWEAAVRKMHSPSIVLGYFGHRKAEEDGDFHLHDFRVLYRNDTRSVTRFTFRMMQAQDYSKTPKWPIVYTNLTPFTAAIGEMRPERIALGFANADAMQLSFTVADRKDEFEP